MNRSTRMAIVLATLNAVAGIGGPKVMAQERLHGYDIANMNLDVRPGDDFLQYATGAYLKNHPLRDDQMTNGAFYDLYELNNKQIQELILQFSQTPQEPGSIGQKIGTIYNQMMDIDTRNAEGFKPLLKNLEKIRAVKDIREYQLVTAQIDRRGESTMMFAWNVGPDQGDADNNIVSISQAGLGLGERDYYLNDDPQSVAVREAYKAYGRKLFTLVGYDEETAASKVDAIYRIEERLAVPSYSRVQRRDIEGNYHKMSYQQLIAEFPGIDWPTIFWVTGFPAFDYVDVGQPEPLHEVEQIYAETSLEDLKSYAEARVISGAASCLSADFRAAYFEFQSAMTGQPEDDPLWKQATNLVNAMMADPIGQMYCEKYFPESSKQRVLKMVHDLQTALGQRIDEAVWMSNETKEAAKDKLMSFTVKIGYPDKWRDYSALTVSDSVSLYENLGNISEYLWLHRLNRRVNKPVDKSEWYMSPQTVNAYYNPSANEIVFPAGILQPPFFDPEADDALNYGGIGCVIGHEMSHGFDDQGCQFDKYGNVRNWWTEADKANFDRQTKVLEDYFSCIEVVNGQKVNGKQTLGENIGDNGGINVALRALHNAMADGTAQILLEDQFTPDQRFFFGWAQIWTSNNRDQYLDALLKMDVHSPNTVRINGALPHIDAWYDAFGVKKGDKLFVPKKKRAKVW